VDCLLFDHPQDLLPVTGVQTMKIFLW